MKKAIAKSEEGLPREAFAIVGDAQDPATWRLPHHTRGILRGLAGRLSTEETVDWNLMESAVAALSVASRKQRVQASPGQIIEAARHLAGHYREAGQPLPDTLAALV